MVKSLDKKNNFHYYYLEFKIIKDLMSYDE